MGDTINSCDKADRIAKNPTTPRTREPDPVEDHARGEIVLRSVNGDHGGERKHEGVTGVWRMVTTKYLGPVQGIGPEPITASARPRAGDAAVRGDHGEYDVVAGAAGVGNAEAVVFS